jgi:phosphatidylglycerophosphate synthase
MGEKKSYRVPNAIIAGRVALAFVAAWLLTVGGPLAGAVAVGLVVAVVALDAVDGYVARRMGLASDLGGVLDITADRIVEHVFWITFAAMGQIGLWVPLVVMTRSFLVDAVRAMALVSGRTAFGSRSMARSHVTLFLTSSRFMRNAYGGAKVAAFVLLGLLVTTSAGAPPPTSGGTLTTLAGLSVLVAVGLCLLRGIPVLADARGYVMGSGDRAAPTGS